MSNAVELKLSLRDEISRPADASAAALKRVTTASLGADKSIDSLKSAVVKLNTPLNSARKSSKSAGLSAQSLSGSLKAAAGSAVVAAGAVAAVATAVVAAGAALIAGSVAAFKLGRALASAQDESNKLRASFSDAAALQWVDSTASQFGVLRDEARKVASALTGVWSKPGEGAEVYATAVAFANRQTGVTLDTAAKTFEDLGRQIKGLEPDKLREVAQSLNINVDDIAAGYGVTTDELLKMAKAGELTGSQVAAALIRVNNEAEGASSAVEAASKSAQRLESTPFVAVENSVSALKESLRDSFFDAFGDSISDLSNNLVPVIESVSAFISETLAGKGAVGEFFAENTELVGILKQAGKGLGLVVVAVGAIAAALTAVPLAIFAAQVTAMSYGVMRAVTQAKAVFNTLKSTITTVAAAFSAIPESVRTMSSNVLATITSLPSLFLTAGTNIVNSIAAGITAGAGTAVDAMRNVVSRVRDLLPFSPAKDGPLKDIHKIKLVETISDSLQPEPLVDKMSDVLSAGVDVSVAHSPSVAAQTGSASMRDSVGKSEASYNVTVNMGAGSSSSDSSLADLIARSVREVLRDIDAERVLRST